MGSPLPGASPSFRIHQLPQHCPEFSSSKTALPQNHTPPLPHAVVPSPGPPFLQGLPPRGPHPWVSFLSSVLSPITTGAPPFTCPKSPALVAVLSLMSLIRVNRISSLPCCDVSNLSAPILASCLSTSTFPSLFLFLLLFPTAFTVISDSSPGFLLPPYRSFCVGCFFLCVCLHP